MSAFVTTEAITDQLSQPSSFLSEPQSTSEIRLTWSSIQNPSGVYTLTRDGGIIYTGTGTSFSNTDLVPSTTYNYSLTATLNSSTSDPLTLQATTNKKVSIILPPIIPPPAPSPSPIPGPTPIPTPDPIDACLDLASKLNPNYSASTSANFSSTIARTFTDGSSVSITVPQLPYALQISIIQIDEALLDMCKIPKTYLGKNLVPGMLYNIRARRADNGQLITDFSNNPLLVSISLPSNDARIPLLDQKSANISSIQNKNWTRLKQTTATKKGGIVLTFEVTGL